MTKHELEVLADKVAMARNIDREKSLKTGKKDYYSENMVYVVNPIIKRLYRSLRDKLRLGEWGKVPEHERMVWELSLFSGETLALIEIYSDSIINKYKKDLEEKRLAEERKLAKAKKVQEKKTPEPTTEQLSFYQYR